MTTIRRSASTDQKLSSFSVLLGHYSPTEASISKCLVPIGFFVAGLVAIPAAAFAQEWVPGSEIVGQSVVIETNGVANTVYFDAGGAARIVSPQGRVVNASWTAANSNICINSGVASECWPYQKAFNAGQRVTLTSNCQSVSSWIPNGTNAPPIKEVMQERG